MSAEQNYTSGKWNGDQNYKGINIVLWLVLTVYTMYPSMFKRCLHVFSDFLLKFKDFSFPLGLGPARMTSFRVFLNRFIILHSLMVVKSKILAN